MKQKSKRTDLTPEHQIVPKGDPVGIADMAHVRTDPQGSWTGVPHEPDEVPVQDADDL